MGPIPFAERLASLKPESGKLVQFRRESHGLKRRYRFSRSQLTVLEPLPGSSASRRNWTGAGTCKHADQKLLALAAHEIRRSIDTAFRLYAMELLKSVPNGFL